MANEKLTDAGDNKGLTMKSKTSTTEPVVAPTGKIARVRVQHVVRHYRALRVGERVRDGDQFYFYSSPHRWKKAMPDQVELYSQWKVPHHYKGRFRRLVANAEALPRSGATLAAAQGSTSANERKL